MKNSKILIVALILSVIIYDNSFALDARRKLAIVAQQAPPQLPCHQLGVHYNQGFPANIVGASVQSSRATPEEYTNATFSPISVQKYDDGKKHYILPAYYADYEDIQPVNGAVLPTNDELRGEFVGYISYRVALIEQVYDSENHGRLPFRAEGRANGFNAVAPIKKVVKEPVLSDVDIGGSTPVSYEAVEKVFIEYCFDPIAWSPEGNFGDLYVNYMVDQFKLGDIAHLLYPTPEFADPLFSYSGQTPVALGFWMHWGDELQTYQNRLQLIESAVFLVASFTPGVNSILSINEATKCSAAGESFCWLKASGDVLSDIAIFLKFAKGAKIIGTSIPVSVPANAAIYMSVGANLGMASVYTYREQYLNAAGALLASSSDLFSLKLGDGNLELKNLGTANAKCSVHITQTEAKGIDVKTNFFEHTECPVRKTEAKDIPCSDDECVAGGLVVSPARNADEIRKLNGIENFKTQKYYFDYYEGVTPDMMGPAAQARFPGLPGISASADNRIEIKAGTSSDPLMRIVAVTFSDPGSGRVFRYKWHTPTKDAPAGTGPVIRIERAASKSKLRAKEHEVLLNISSPFIIQIGGQDVDLSKLSGMTVDGGHLWMAHGREAEALSATSDPLNQQLLSLSHPESPLTGIYNRP